LFRSISSGKAAAPGICDSPGRGQHQEKELTSIANCGINSFHYTHMRTTVNLDEDILRMADQLAESHGISRGEAISQLARRGVQQVQKPLPTKVRNGFVVLDLKGAKRFSSDEVVLALDREETGRARRYS
jgi:hypothetical protein